MFVTVAQGCPDSGPHRLELHKDPRATPHQLQRQVFRFVPKSTIQQAHRWCGHSHRQQLYIWILSSIRSKFCQLAEPPRLPHQRAPSMVMLRRNAAGTHVRLFFFTKLRLSPDLAVSKFTGSMVAYCCRGPGGESGIHRSQDQSALMHPWQQQDLRHTISPAEFIALWMQQTVRFSGRRHRFQSCSECWRGFVPQVRCFLTMHGKPSLMM